MLSIQGVGGVPEPTGPKQGSSKAKDTEKAPASSDGVSISSEAAQAAEVITAISASAKNSEIRQERVEAARQNIESGAYKVQDVVRQVAERLTKYVS